MGEQEPTRPSAPADDWFDAEWEDGARGRTAAGSGATAPPGVSAGAAAPPGVGSAARAAAKDHAQATAASPDGAPGVGRAEDAPRVEAPDDEAAEADAGARRFRVPVKTLVFLVAALVGLYFVWPQILGFFDAVPGLRTIHWYWFLLMAALQAASLAFYWAVMRVTVEERRWSVLAMTQLASNAFGRIVPGGAATAGSMGYQMLVAAGCPKGRAVTGLTATTLLSTAVLVALPVLSLPAILAGAPIGDSLMRAFQFGIVVAVLIVAGGAVALFTDRTLLWIGRVVQRVLDRVRKRGAPRTGLPSLLIDERDLIKRALGDKWWVALPCAAGHRLLDLASLLAALAAVGATARPSLVLLAYVVAGLLGTVPLTPGGVGFVEVGLVAMLGLAGVGAAEATAAVLAYRLVQFWLPIPVGIVAGALFTRRYGARARRRAVAAGDAS